MAHGGPDWSTGGQISTVHTIEDLGELAARLGSIDTFDRRGNVLAFDDFESGIGKWYRSGDAGYDISWDGNHGRNGGFCCKIMTGGAAGRVAYIYRRFGYPVLSRLGFEFSFATFLFGRYLELKTDLQTAAGLHSPAIRYVALTDTFEYNDDAGIYQTIPDLTWRPMDTAWGFDTIKLVVDYISNEYVRLIVNNQVIDLSGISYQVGTVPAIPYGTLEIRLTTDVAAQARTWVDDVIVTQNEP